MDITPKSSQIHTFSGGMDSDQSPETMPPNKARYMLNVRSTTYGQKGVITNIKGNVLITTPLPSGTNLAIGWGADEEHGQFYFIVWNSNNYHTVFMYDESKGSVIIVLQSITDSNGIDILMLNKDYMINHVDIVQSINGPLILWCDGYNKAVKFNRNKALDKSSSGYGLIIQRDFVVAYKQAPVYAPIGTYYTDNTRQSNFLYGKLFKFCTRFIYDDGEQSNWSDWSTVPLPPNQSYSGDNTITYDNNCILVSFETGNQLVVKIELAMKVNSADFVITSVLDKSLLGIQDGSTYVYNFYNDGSDETTDQNKINRLYSFLPDKPFCQAFVKNALLYAKFYEGFASVPVQLSVSISYQDIYIPDGSADILNSPSFQTQLITNGYGGATLGFNSRYNVEQKFIIGFDVKSGNKFQLWGKNGKSANYYYTYTATVSDDATTVANKIKAFLRGIGRGYPTNATGGVTQETTDGEGNVSWLYTILGFWDESPIVWTTYVNAVNFVILKDDGSSVNLIKPGSTRKYALAYMDDDGRVGLANTADTAVATTAFITQTGDLKMAVHSITISNAPPLWAKYYYLLRTPDSGPFIQLLIQQVIEVDPSTLQTAQGDSQVYLDLVVGSLFTYQKLHPNTIITYDFTKGDRLRPIKYYDITNGDTPVLYPYLETEVLSYNINTTELVNANITSTGNDVVTPGDGPRIDYVGKNIVINGIERTIIGVTGNTYVLDEVLNLSDVTNSTPQTVVYPNYSFIDRRGILRIKKPDTTINNFSLIEIYKIQQNTSVEGYKQFFPFGIKLEIGNAGLPNAFHYGTVQNQNGSTPAIISVTQGDAYIRNRELPTNDVVPGTQILVDHVIDPNFSDFYESNLTSLGRVIPQDDGSGVKYFGSRIRFSNNYIEDTKINGLNDFDNSDRQDYNDPFGDIMLIKFRESRLKVFKALKTGWIGIYQNAINQPQGRDIISTTNNLLNQMYYYSWQGGIGNNPESYVSNGNYDYFASANSGVFLRLAGDGCDPISSIYGFDQETRSILSAAQKQGLNIYGGFDRENSEVIWYIPGYNNYIFKGGFIAGQWNTYNAALPTGTTFEIVQQPQNGSSVSIDSNGMFAFVAGNNLGIDSFSYRAKLANGTYLPARNECFSVITIPGRPTVFQGRSSSQYCIVRITAFEARLSSAYCVTRQTAFRVRSSSAYCAVTDVGFRPRLSSAYCLQQASIPLNNFDFMVLRYIWTTGSGIDLDTFTGLIGTGTPYDGSPTTRQGWVGYGQNPDPSTGVTGTGSRVIPYGSSTPYLNWGTDNTTGAGVEAILVDLKQFIADYPNTPSPISVQMNTVWYNTLESGNITVEVVTYKGGTMSLDSVNHNFVNTGGTLVDQIDLPYRVSLQSRAYLITSSQPTARMDFDKTTNTASLTIL